VLGGEAEQGRESGHGCAAAVEAEDDLVDVVGQVLGAGAVMGTGQLGLKVGEARWARGGCLAAFFGSPITVGWCSDADLVRHWAVGLALAVAVGAGKSAGRFPSALGSKSPQVSRVVSLPPLAH
jgi:hypothetical protein